MFYEWCMSRSNQPDRHALAALHEQAFQWALFCCRFDEDQAREVMQTVYLEILSGKALFSGKSSLRTWLFAVVKRTALRLAHRETRSVRLAAKVALTENGAAHAPSADHVIIELETQQMILRALGALSDQQRAIVELVYYHDLSVIEAASILNIRVGTARTHFHRAKESLSRVLEQHRGDLGDG